MKKRILPIIMAIAMIVSLMPTMAFAAPITADDGALEVASADDLLTAIQNAESGMESAIRLTEGITIDQTIEIPAGREIVLDLNGQKIESTVDGYTLVNNGTLTINDETDAGIICNTSTGVANEKTHFILRNYGDMTINGGTFGDTDTDRDNANTANWGAAIINMEGNCTINGGYFTCGDNYWSGKPAGANYSYAIRNYATMHITDGTVYGKMNGGIAADGGVVTIDKGAFSVTGSNTYYVLVTNADAGKIIVNGGTFTKLDDTNKRLLGGFSGMPSWDATESLEALEKNGYTINGGTFAIDEEVVNLTAVAETNCERYFSLKTAMDAAQDGGKVTLVSDCTVDSAITIDKNLTLDLNGYVVSNLVESDRPFQVTAAVEFTVDGTVDGSGMEIPDGNTESFGFIKITAPATVTLSGGTYVGVTNKGAFIKPFSNEDQNIDASGCTISLYDVTAQTNMWFLSTDTLTTMTLTVEGGSYTSNGVVVDNNTTYSVFGTDCVEISAPLTFTGVTVTSSGGACIEACGGTATLTDCTFTVQEASNPAFTASAVATSWEGVANITSGTYASAGYGAYVYSSGGTINVTGGTITGRTAAVRADVDETYGNPAAVAISGGQISGALQTNGNEKATITVTGGYFTDDPSEYLVQGYIAGDSDDSAYTYHVVEATNADTPAEVVPAAPAVDTGNLTQEEAEEVSAALAGVEAELTAAANTQADQNAVTKEQAEQALTNASINTADKTVTVVVQPYLSIQVAEYTSSEVTDSNTMTLDITPMYRTVATTADLTNAVPEEIKVQGDEGVAEANAVEIKGESGILPVTGSVEITIPLPSGFVNNTDSVYVQHKGYEYTATVTSSGEPSPTYTATFVNPHGFSEFTITTAPTAEAELNDTAYTSLSDALNHANDGDTVTVLKDELTASMSGSSRTITLSNTTGKPITVTINGKPIEIAAGSTFEFSYTAPSSGGTTSYAITTENTENGTLSVSQSRAFSGQTVTITVTPGKGYKLDILTATDRNGDKLKLTKASDTKYTFTMPGSAVKITATFVEEEVINTLPFHDVDADDWFYRAVKYVYDNGMMNGIGNSLFAPNSNLNRAMMVQVLWNLEGNPHVSTAIQYSDVASDAWYYDAVQWATAEGIVDGYGNGIYGPEDDITREQMALMFYRYAQHKGYDTTHGGMEIREFTDYAEISDWALEAVTWAVNAGLLNGKGNHILDPIGDATRAEVAQILMNFCENIAE